MRKNFGLLAVATLAALPLASQAGAPTPTLGQVLDASGITARGYVDAGYSATNLGTPNANSFALNQVALTLAKQPTEGFGGLVNLSLGNDVAKYGINTAYGDAPNNFAITQAYVQYATGALTVIGGRFVTLAGEEVIDQTQDANISRSLLFGIQTLVHTGVRATYKVSDQLSVIGGVNNTAFGADVLGVDANPQKAIELGATFAPASNLSMALSHYREASGAATVGETDLTDFVANLQASQALALGFNADYKHTQSGTVVGSVQKGAALYAGYQFCDQIKGTLRAEYLKGQGSTDGIAKELTYTVDYVATKNFNLLAEYRYDHATIPAGKTVGSTVGVKAIYSF
ncbi:MAG: outer membrane beta-barrel protein [Stenotrophobium sp.]